MYEFIRHTVRKGNIVIYPRWQTDIATPCPGPFDIEPCMTSAVNGIRGGLAYLAENAGRVQPQLGRTSYFGFSFGGIITANLANRYAALGLPAPKAIFLDDPHDGGLNGFDEPALDDSLSGIPKTVKLECHSGADGIISVENRANGSCNALFPKLAHIPKRNKDLVLTHTDTHGDPPFPRRTGCARGGRGSAGPLTPTTGTSAGRCGTPCGRARTAGRTAGTHSATPASIAPWASGATACRSPR
jgi:hypothetical protein